MVGRHGVQREFSLELGKGLLLRPAPRCKAPQCARVESEISGYRRILEVAVVGGEQVELVIAPALMSNPFAKDHRPQFQLPNLKPQESLETADLRLHRRPALLRADRRTPVHWQNGTLTT